MPARGLRMKVHSCWSEAHSVGPIFRFPALLDEFPRAGEEGDRLPGEPACTWGLHSLKVSGSPTAVQSAATRRLLDAAAAHSVWAVSSACPTRSSASSAA